MRDERGFTVPELLVGAVVSLVIAAGAMGLLMAAVSRQPATSERAGQIQQGRAMIERVVRELRQGESVLTATPASLTTLTLVNSASCGGLQAATKILCRVTYSCSTTTCSRTEANPNGTAPGPAVRVVGGLISASVFSYTPASDPSYVGIQLQFGAAGEEAITLEDGTALRNWFEAEA